MKIINSYYCWASDGAFYLFQDKNRFFVQWGIGGYPDDRYATYSFKTVKAARRKLLALVWDNHPNFRGEDFPKTSPKIKAFLGA